MNDKDKKARAGDRPAKTGLWDKDMSRGLSSRKDQLDKLRVYHTAPARFCKERTGTSFVERIFFRDPGMIGRKPF